MPYQKTAKETPSLADSVANIKAFRYYEPFKLWGGRRGSRLLVGNPHNLKTITKGPAMNAITVDEVIMWFNDYNLEYSGINITEAVSDLNIIRLTEHFKYAVTTDHPLEMAYKQTDKALTILSENLPKLIALGRGHNPAPPGAPLNEIQIRRKDMTNALAGLLESVQDVRRHLPAAPPKHRHEPWHDDADFLSIMLELAHHPSGKPVGFTKRTSRGVKFIHRALSRAGVRCGSADAIARQLARRKAE
jgi:hypothetical protein